mgnify:CR=1 FL=1
MKILYDHQIFASQTYGGVSRYFAEVIHRLRNEYGLPIKAEDVKVKNRNGRLVKIARYQLITE